MAGAGPDRDGRAASLLAGSIAGCTACPRLAAFLAAQREREPGWWNRPVPGFGDPAARLLVLGLAPGRGGANRTGRPFTGDAAGVWLFAGLHRLGLATRPEGAARGDGLRLPGVYVTNAVKCVPPGNRPHPEEVRRCAPFLRRELARLRGLRAILVLGRVAHGALAGVAGSALPAFGHGAAGVVAVEGAALQVVCSYHPSRQNTATRRLTPAMWAAALDRAARLAGLAGGPLPPARGGAS